MVELGFESRASLESCNELSAWGDCCQLLGAQELTQHALPKAAVSRKCIYTLGSCILALVHSLQEDFF